MAQEYQTTDGNLVNPGAYASWKVVGGVGGVAANGILMLIGESSAGPDFSEEDDLNDNAYGPDQLADVVAKYGDGPLVDAFRIAASPANDPDIQGAPSLIVLAKTNPSVKASSALLKVGGGAYGTLYAKSEGLLGNVIYYKITDSVSEVKPTTGSFTYIPPVATANIDLRQNGGAALAVSVTANMTPTAFVAALNGALASVASGGVNRNVIAVSGTLGITASGNDVLITRSTNWVNLPVIGDTLTIDDGSVLDNVGNDNAGGYVVTGVTANTISATKLSDAGATGAAAGTISAPATVAPQAIAAVTDIICYSPVVVADPGSAVLPGQGKVLEINHLTTGTDLFTRCAFVLGTTTAVSWLSTSATPARLVSASEQKVNISINRQSDSIVENIPVGGQIALELGYVGTTAAVVLSATQMVITLAGGVSSGLSPITIELADYPTIADLAAYLDSIPGFACSVGSNALGQISPLALDEITGNAGSTHGSKTLRIKVDAVKFFEGISSSSVLVQFGDPVLQAASGLPELVATYTYLAGGAKGATTDTIFSAALTALESVAGNFVVPLFSRDATADIADGKTASGSTYTIASVHAAVKEHIIKMSAFKRRKPRQGLLALRSTYEAAKDAAAGIASFRCTLCLQDFKALNSAGSVVQLHPWASAVNAAAMQAAGFYRSIVHKGINTSGMLQAAGDFSPTDETVSEEALKSGLLFAKKSDDGGYIWVSDQNTYIRDNNFVYNSLQTVYAADLVAQTAQKRMEKAFVGQSQADVTADTGLSMLTAIMADLLRLKLIASSEDAKRGFKDAVVRIVGPAMLVSANVKVAGTVYFCLINFSVSMVTSSASG